MKGKSVSRYIKESIKSIVATQMLLSSAYAVENTNIESNLTTKQLEAFMVIVTNFIVPNTLVQNYALLVQGFSFYKYPGS